jgi:polysaccharide export outer membrane protein
MLHSARGGGETSPFSGRLKTLTCGFALVAAALALPGCAVLPASAPTAGEIENAADNASNGIFVFDLDQSVIAALATTRQDSFVGRFANKAPAADLRIAVGDTLQIAVIDEASGLFGRSSDTSSSGFGSTTLLPVTVGRNGDINVPFAGEIRAAGLTLDDLRARIERKLGDKAVNPQVQVVMVTAPGMGVGANSAAVGGEVAHSGVFALRPSGTRLLDLIAEAGASRFPAYETTVHLTRGKREAAVSLQRIVDRVDENIYVYPGDSIYLSHDPKTFSVLGASTKVGRYPFGTESLNLAEAVAEAGGFVDTVSDPSGVFLFRYESADLVKALRPEATLASDPTVPVIYRLNLRDGDGFFRARQFSMRDKDIILLANADGTQLLKFMNLLGSASSVATNVRTLTLPSTTGGGSTTTVVTP